MPDAKNHYFVGANCINKSMRWLASDSEIELPNFVSEALIFSGGRKSFGVVFER